MFRIGEDRWLISKCETHSNGYKRIYEAAGEVF